MKADTYPCCDHCQYPGCPEWDQEHPIRCMRCLDMLCADHADDVDLGTRMTRLRAYLSDIEKGEVISIAEVVADET